MTKKTRFRIELYEEGEVAECYLDGEPLEPEGDNAFFVESARLKGVRLSQIPDGVLLVPIKGVESDVILIDLPIKISKYANERAVVHVQIMERRKYWDEEVGLSKYVSALQKALEMRASSISDVEDIATEDDGDYVFVNWTQVLTEDLEAQDALSRINEAYDEIMAHTDQLLYGFKPNPKEVNDESTYTKKVIIPMLIGMGFQDVHYNHGQREFGKDITFSRLDEFGVLRHFGAQIKFGDVSGEAAGEVDEIIGQIADAFAMPYTNLYGKDDRHISELYIIASGRFTFNAQQKILGKVVEPGIRSNVVFLDGEKITELIERRRSAG